MQRAEEEQNQKAAAAETEFRKIFLNEFGTLNCAEIKKRETGWSGMDDVIGITVRLVDQALGSAQQKP